MRIILATGDIDFSGEVLDLLQYTYRIDIYRTDQLEKVLDLNIYEAKEPVLLITNESNYDYVKGLTSDMQNINLIIFKEKEKPTALTEKRIVVSTASELKLVLQLSQKENNYEKVKYRNLLDDLTEEGVFDDRQDKNIRKISNAIDEKYFFCLLGEENTGKEFMARKACLRSNKPFFVVDGKSNNLDALLFGHGDVSGFINDYDIVIILKNAEYISTRMLKKINRATMERKFSRQGVNVDLDCSKFNIIFLIASMDIYTNRHAGYYKFREESILNILPVTKWRKRRLSLFMSALLEKETGLDVSFLDDAKNILQKHGYKGNIEELIEITHYIKRQLPKKDHDFQSVLVDRGMLPLYMTLKEKTIQSMEISEHPLKEILDASTFSLTEIERVVIKAVYKKNNFIKTKAAKEMGISVSSFRDRMNKYGIKEEKRI